MYYTSHCSWKRRAVSTTLPSFSSNYTNQPENRWKQKKIQGCHQKPIPIFSSNSLLRTNHTKQFAREEPTHARMNQQGSAKPESQECLQAPEVQPGTRRVFFRHTQAFTKAPASLSGYTTAQCNQASSSPGARSQNTEHVASAPD